MPMNAGDQQLPPDHTFGMPSLKPGHKVRVTPTQKKCMPLSIASVEMHASVSIEVPIAAQIFRFCFVALRAQLAVLKCAKEGGAHVRAGKYLGVQLRAPSLYQALREFRWDSPGRHQILV
eukprot:1158527-Pelagomonas_calceolata.AAC.3